MKWFSHTDGFGASSTAMDVTEGIDASGLTAIVTGGANGIGAETAKILALRGVHVLIAGRNLGAAAKVKEDILKERHDAQVNLLQLDLSSMASVKKCVDDFSSMKLPLNILINNAGLMRCPYQLSQDGIEMQFATNHIGHFLLTKLLLQKMKDSAKQCCRGARIVIVTSSWHKFTYAEGIRFDQINSSHDYVPLKNYGQSKLANILHCNELARRLKEEGADVTVNCVHPGFILTNLQRNMKLYAYFWRIFAFFLWKTVSQGAATSCYVALHPRVEGVSGKYFSDCHEAQPAPMATDPELARKLWDFTEKMIASSQSLHHLHGNVILESE
eukprot:c55490_g1_i1 orf=98-1084(+)